MQSLAHFPHLVKILAISLLQLSLEVLMSSSLPQLSLGVRDTCSICFIKILIYQYIIDFGPSTPFGEEDITHKPAATPSLTDLSNALIQQERLEEANICQIHIKVFSYYIILYYFLTINA